MIWTIGRLFKKINENNDGGEKNMLNKEKEKVLLTFLQLTKDGEYVRVDIDEGYTRCPYLRVEEEENYYYSTR